MLSHRNRHANPGPNMDDVVKSGYLKKLKTMKRKFYVLRRETAPNSPARLEYYDNERKFRGGVAPKKAPILLRNCFSINRKMDPKHHNVLALYMSEDSVSLAAESEPELNEWLGYLHSHMHDAMAGEEGQAWKPYEHVWMVVVQPRSLGSSKNLAGDYRICLTYKSIALVKIGGVGQEKIEFPLSTVRRCGHTGSFFFLGLGRSAVTGAGDIWMLTEDAVIAENMHGIIRKAMHTPCNNSGLVDDPVSRERTKSMSNHPSVESVCTHTGVGTVNDRGHVRERCGSMPSRGRTSSEGSNHKHQPHHHICHHHNCDGVGGVVGVCPVCAVTTSSSSTTSTVASFCPHITRPQSIPSSSESMESTASGDDIDGHLPITPENLADDDEDNYLAMDPVGGEGGGGGGGCSSVGSHHHHHHCYHCFHQQHHHHHHHPPCSLPIINTHSLASPLAKGLISPVSQGSSNDGPPCLSSPQDQYMNMSSPSEGRGAYGAEGSLDRRLGSLERGYLMMDRATPNPPTTTTTTTTTSDTLGYLAMCPSLNSPGSLHPAWPPHPSSQVSPHSGRLASVVDEGNDNYLSMVPASGGGGGGGGGSGGDGAGRDGGYLDMNMTPTPTVPTPIPHSPSDGDSFPEMSPGSSCSFTSGTPSSDHRFPDFIAEKCGQVGGGNESYGCSEDDDSSLDRPFRTNSVGSKPEQYRSRKNSAPILGTSPISNSWSGTPGTFFRGFLQARSQERNDDLMEFDFTKNKSCDSISGDKEKKSSSFESIKRTFKRSSSKSSGNGKFFVPDSMKRDKKKSESELSNKSLDFNYYEVEINPSPRRKTSDSYEGYLPMRPAINTGQPISASDYLDMSSRDALSRQSNYMDMRTGVEILGGSSCSVGSSEGYVDMSEGKGLGPLPINQSSGSSTSSIPGSSFPNGAKVRKFSPTLNALSSHDDQYMSVDLRSNIDPPHSHEGEKHKKKEKRSIRRKSLKDSTRRKKSEPISMIGKSDGENLHEVSKKGTSPLSSLSFSSLLGRKTSTSTPPPKTPLSPTGSPLPKSTRGTPSPFSSLQRNKNRDDKDGRKDSISKDSGMTSSLSSLGTGCIQEASREAEESAMSAILGNALSTTHPSQVPNDLNCMNTLGSGSKRASAIYEVPQTIIKEEESRTGSEVSNQSTSHQVDSEHGAYVNLTPGSSEKTAPAEKQRKLSNVSTSLDYMNISPISSSKVSESEGSQSRDYMNMCPGGRAESSHSNLLTPKSSSSPRTPSPCDPSRQGKDSASSPSSQPGKDPVTPSSCQSTPKHQRHRISRRFSDQESIETGGDEESGYLLMTPGQPSSSTKPLSPQTVTRRPDIPTSLLPSNSKDSTSPDPTLMATLERLNLGGNNERCRSHSGPGAPEGSAVGGEGRVKKQLSEPRGGAGNGVGTGKAASACSSPVSHSPPTSPTLGGSVSSVSSLSEGGLSSASSTCTVVNMGLVRREGSQSGSTRLQETTTTSAETSTHSTVASNQSSANTGTTSSGGGTTSSGSGVASSSSGGSIGGGGGSRSGSDVGLNYVALDLGVAKTPGVRPSPRMARKTPPAQPTTTTATTTPSTTATASVSASVPQDSGEEEDEEPLSYAQIDFTKSEGLRTTSLTRDHRH